MPNRFCTQCGAELRSGLKFCPKCGASLNKNYENRPAKSIDKEKIKKITNLVLTIILILIFVVSATCVMFSFFNGSYVDWVNERKDISLISGALLVPLLFVFVGIIAAIFVISTVLLILKLLKKTENTKLLLVLFVLGASLSLALGLLTMLKAWDMDNNYGSFLMVIGILGFVDLFFFIICLLDISG